MSRVPLAIVSLITALALSACGDGSAPEHAAAPEPSPARTHSARATPAPSPSATPPAAPTQGHHRHKVGTLAPRTRTANTADLHLLAADRLPMIGRRAWTVDTKPAAGAVGACQKTDLGTIGAVDTVSRTFTAEDGLAATQVVARFADAKSAWRAHRVLAAWRDDCGSRVERADVGPLQPITVHTGTADGYRGSFRSRSAGLGILRAGDYLTLVEVTATGDRYPGRWDPARVAVRRIARTF
ncbi:MAG TPA: hypothetical protein VFT70_04630 [Nocardioides sp.]|nr:hypothetical protein [Nocardioides sp.]